MDLFRVVEWDGISLRAEQGGPLFVHRDVQGDGRHDVPELYAAWYCALEAVSAVAEVIKRFRGQVLTNEDFSRREGLRRALVSLRITSKKPLIDLDDAATLLARGLRPSQVASAQRATTQRIASAIFNEGAAGLQWWSTLKADWTNVTLFHERVASSIELVAPPRVLTVDMAEVRAAADHLGVFLARA